jgi:hypothetical protein
VARWSLPHVGRLRLDWRQTPFHGALLGIASVALATAGVALICAAIAAIVTWIY